MEPVEDSAGLNLTHWRIEPRPRDMVAAVLDRQGEEQNSLSAAVVEELDIVLNQLTARRPKGLLIESGKAGGFIVGADVREFTLIEDQQQALSRVESTHLVFEKLEKLPFPTVAVIRGFCLGGGLELALACRYRVVADDVKTRLGLPEVLLGIHPGFGGTARLLYTVGPLKAMDIMLTGKNVYPRPAGKMGLADKVVPIRHLQRAALWLVENDPGRHTMGPSERLMNSAPARKLLARIMRDKIAKRADPRHYPAPYALVDLWQRHGGNREQMLREEARSVSGLIVGNTARNLVRVFFLQEKLKSLGKPTSQSSSFKAAWVHVIGAGVMGGDIAAWCAAQGLKVSIQDNKPEALGRVVARARALFADRLRDRRRIQDAMDRFIPDAAGQGVANADVIIEAIFEDAGAKRELFSQIEPRARKDAVLATNTSSIPLEILATALHKPSRLVGLHFFNPVAKMQLVEIVVGHDTARIESGRASVFARQIGRLPVPVRSSPGFLVNRVLTPYLMEAVELARQGVPLVAIDRAAVDFGMPMGPIELADTVGLDICLSVAENLDLSIGGSVPDELKHRVDAGHIGRKSGRGFYQWKNGKPQKPAVDKDFKPPADLGDRMMLRYLNEVVACWREAVVPDRSLIDAGLIFGTGFAPFLGGPMHYISSEGAQSLKSKLESLSQQYGERFTPDTGWEDLPVDDPAGDQELPASV